MEYIWGCFLFYHYELQTVLSVWDHRDFDGQEQAETFDKIGEIDGLCDSTQKHGHIV